MSSSDEYLLNSVELEYDDESEFEFEDEDDDENDEAPTTKTGYANGNFQNINTNYLGWQFEDFIQSQFIDSCSTLHQQQLPQLLLDEILIMLHAENWQSDSVINDFYDNASKLQSKCGLPRDSVALSTFKKASLFCPVCAETHKNVDTYSLSCGHIYCQNCYLLYVETKIAIGDLVTCMTYECDRTIPHRDIAVLLRIPGPLLKNPLLQASAKKFVAKHKEFKWCPSVDCNAIVNYPNAFTDSTEDSNLLNIVNVTCPNQHEFCYRCLRENHFPCPCWLVDLWVKKCKDDSETANWIQANTQACPRCDSVIEKNGGCNHMTCKKCAYEFCWICLGDWANHGREWYQCNRFDPNNLKSIKKTQQLKRLTLQRYLHYYTRFSVHESSMKGDKKVLAKVDLRMKQYMELHSKRRNEHNLSWNDVQFLHDAIRALTSGRKTLKWTYCFAFYLDRTNFAEIFESMQDYLTKTVEDLSQIFEEINSKKNNANNKSYDVITKYKAKTISLSNLVTKRQSLLIEFAQSGIQQKQLVFVH